MMTQISRHDHEAEILARMCALDYPVRQKSAAGQPKPLATIERTCKGCGAAFLGHAPGKTGERGIWQGWRWYCSVECAEGDGVQVDPLSGHEGMA